MSKIRIRNWLPEFLSIPLWGDREKWGLVVKEDDACWKEWEKSYLNCYNETQRGGLGTIVNDAGYRVMEGIDLENKTILEIGPGDIRHIHYWNGRPKEYLLMDVKTGMLVQAEKKLADANIDSRSFFMRRGDPLPLENNSVDIVVSFYSLEHIYPLQPYVDELKRILRPGGLLAGAIPTEGGFVWGLGRYLTSRRWFKKNTSIDPDKLICWEHPNFADEVINILDRTLTEKSTTYWPFRFLKLLDSNLIISFTYEK